MVYSVFVRYFLSIMNGLLHMPRFVTTEDQIHEVDFSGFSQVTHYLLVFVEDVPIA